VPRARRAIDLAHEEARRLNHDYIGTAHLLLGLIREADGPAARVLAELGADLSLMGRDMDRLHQIAQAIRQHFDSRMETYQVDVTDQGSMQRTGWLKAGGIA